MDEKRLASFFVDDSESDKYEEVADFYIAWTLRCAEKKYEIVDNIVDNTVHTCSKKLLSLFIKDNADYLNNKDVISVKTWKQWNSIDIWVEAKIQEECGPKLYPFIIEDKYCSILTDSQLKKYKHIPMYDTDKSNIKYFVIRLEQNDKYDNTDERICADCGYKLLRWTDLKNAMALKEATGNALFDEFWFYWEKDASS
jgi:hypothetical protein